MAEEVLQNQQVSNKKFPPMRAPAPASERPFRAPGPPGRHRQAAGLEGERLLALLIWRQEMLGGVN